MEDKLTIEAFVSKHGITIDCVPESRNPNLRDRNWLAHHYHCVLRRAHLKMPVHYSRGMLVEGQPTAELVLDSLAHLAQHLDQAAIRSELRRKSNEDGRLDPYDDWRAELRIVPGYEDVDFPRQTYDTVVAAVMRLQEFLSTAAYFELLYKTIRIS